MAREAIAERDNVPSLLVTHGYHFGTRFDLLDLTTIGRSSSCTIQLLDEKVSRLHATIYRDGDHFHVRDEGSSNGTGRNGQLLLEPGHLRPGDEVAVGNNLMLYEPRMEILRDRGGAGAVVICDGGDADQIADGGTAALSSGEGMGFQPASLQAAVARVMASSRSSGFAWLLLEALVRGVGAERAALLRLRGKTGLQALLTYPGQSRVTVPRILLDRVQELGKGVRMEDGVSQLKIRGGRTRVESKLGSSLCVPLMRRGELEAILYADTQVRGAFRALPLTVVEDLVSVCYPALLSAVHVPTEGARKGIKKDRPIAQSPSMRHAVQTADHLATRDDSFLVAGEPGSGREELARYVHDHSARRHGPMVTVACDFLPESRAESTLFGHEKGAFAGAASRKLGLLEEADCGTFLLKEIGDLAQPLQLKLLRAIQEGRFYRQGGSRPVYCDVRVAGASHRDLSRMIRDEEFREDLYAQLEPRRIDVAPLRERLEDLEPLIARIVARINSELGVTLKGFEPGALNRLQNHRWRRNVRELEHVLRRVLLLSEGDDVAEEAVAEVLATQVDPAGVDETLELGQAIRRVESRVLVGAMRKAGGRKGRAAAIMGLSREALDRRLAEYGVDLARELAGDL